MAVAPGEALFEAALNAPRADIALRSLSFLLQDQWLASLLAVHAFHHG